MVLKSSSSSSVTKGFGAVILQAIIVFRHCVNNMHKDFKIVAKMSKSLEKFNVFVTHVAFL